MLSSEATIPSSIEEQKEDEVFSNRERISERIDKNYELRLMRTLPEVNDRFALTTIINPEGVYQLNQEINTFRCLFSAEEFTIAHGELCFLLQHATIVSELDGILIYDALTLKQLNTLEQAIRLKFGYTIIGYTINEESYLRSVNFIMRRLFSHTHEYPPLPEAMSRQFLYFSRKPIVEDISVSLRVTIQTYLLFRYLLTTYFQYTKDTTDDYEGVKFKYNYASWYLLSLSVLVALNLLLLRSGLLDRAKLLLKLTRIRFIEESIIGLTSNLTNYGALILSPTLIADSFFPVLVLAGIIGCYRSNKAVVNLAYYTTAHFLLKTFFESLTVGSFCGLGMKGPVFILFFLNTKNNVATQTSYTQDWHIAGYIASTLMLVVSLPRHPRCSLKYQRRGDHASNIVNGISIALLDGYALFTLINLSFIMFYGVDNFSKNKPIEPALYCTFTTLAFLVTFLTTFPGVPNLPEYSLEQNPIKQPIPMKIYRFFNETKTGGLPRAVLMVSRAKPATSIEGVELSAKASTARMWRGFNLFSYSISTHNVHSISPITIENPMQENNVHIESVSLETSKIGHDRHQSQKGMVV